LQLLDPDPGIVEKGRKRQEAIWLGEEPDYLPLLLPGVKVPEAENYPHYNLKEQYYNKEKMLAEHLWGMISQARAKSDAQLSMRANFGTGFTATVFGLNQLVFEDKMPWLKERLPKKKIADMEIEDLQDIEERGLVPKVEEYMSYFVEKLRGKAYVYLADTQGPFDIAHLVRGDDIFLDMFDDPPFVHHLMELTTYVYITISRIMKGLNGEDLDKGYHTTMYMGAGGVRMCEDSTTLLSPALIDEFVIPYIGEALVAFGGGWIHYCGRNDHLFKRVMEMEEVKGVNFGDPGMHEVSEIMREVLDNGKLYFGSWVREEGESLEDYFRRVLTPLEGEKRGLIFQPSGIEVENEDEGKRIMELWHSLQNK